jgi:uncharacterized protein YqjF (DUF2071 family)
MRTVEPSPLWIAPTSPLVVTTPMLIQEWRDVVFLHWRYPPEAVRPHIPAALELDLLDGDAWVTSATFSIPNMRIGPLPPLPGLHTGAESNLRTYVVDPEGRRGLWMLAMDFTPLAAVLVGRFPFLLPYWWSSIDVERTPEATRYAVLRRAPGQATLDVEVSVGAPRPPDELASSDHFLTARWLLYGGLDGVLFSVLSNHPPWTLRQAELVDLRQTVLQSAGLPDPEGPPLVQFSDGVLAKLDRPRVVSDPGVAAA